MPDLTQLNELLNGVRSGDRMSLGRAITLIESRLDSHREIADHVLTACSEGNSESIRLGITGVPGVGKSTFIESLGLALIEKGHRVAVLAIDPSSSISGGSILGDKTRMEKLSASEQAFIRPSPSRGTLGGVAQNTRESILLLEAAGYDVILVETVGVGQSETAVHDLVDCLVLLLLPGAGDELQGMKRGIVELADLLVVNKADNDNVERARDASKEYKRALHLFPPRDSGWNPPVLQASALHDTGLSEVWESILVFREKHVEAGHWHARRQEQSVRWFYEAFSYELEKVFRTKEGAPEALAEAVEQVRSGSLPPVAAARDLLRRFLS